MRQYIIYRDKMTNKIMKYSILNKPKENLDELINEYNDSKHESRNNISELVTNCVLICLIDLAESNKKIKEYQLRDIEYAINNLGHEFYEMRQQCVE